MALRWPDARRHRHQRKQVQSKKWQIKRAPRRPFGHLKSRYYAVRTQSTKTINQRRRRHAKRPVLLWAQISRVSFFSVLSITFSLQLVVFCTHEVVRSNWTWQKNREKRRSKEYFWPEFKGRIRAKCYTANYFTRTHCCKMKPMTLKLKWSTCSGCYAMLSCFIKLYVQYCCGRKSITISLRIST